MCRLRKGLTILKASGQKTCSFFILVKLGETVKQPVGKSSSVLDFSLAE